MFLRSSKEREFYHIICKGDIFESEIKRIFQEVDFPFKDLDTFSLHTNSYILQVYLNLYFKTLLLKPFTSSVTPMTNYCSLFIFDLGSFQGADSLYELYLAGNDLTTIPTGTFADLLSLNYIDLDSNPLQTLEVGKT